MKKILFLLLFMTGCSFTDKTRADFTPPELTDLHLSSPNLINIEFSEQIQVDDLIINVENDFEMVLSSVVDNICTYEITPTPAPGQAVTFHGIAKDSSGNALNFLRTTYGLNPALPWSLINELIIQGSTNHPDCIELRVMEDGNIGGLTLFFGSPENWSFRYIFPAVEVKNGDYLIFHCKPSFITEEITEVSVKNASSGLDSHSDAWDFWPQEVWSLNGNNGLVTITAAPDREPLDCLLYSVRTADSDENYGGFGSKDLYEGAQWLQKVGQWTYPDGIIAPEKAFNPTGTTSTRTINRSSTGTDTNSPDDWHITPTKGATIGYINSDLVYVP